MVDDGIGKTLVVRRKEVEKKECLYKKRRNKVASKCTQIPISILLFFESFLGVYDLSTLNQPPQSHTFTLHLTHPTNRPINTTTTTTSTSRASDSIGCSDYINANFMDGLRRTNAYIATQVSKTLYTTQFNLFIN